MTRFLPTAILCGTLAAGAEAQVNGPRSADYLFLTNVGDARALWVNPAGLAVLPEASVMGEFMLQRETAGDYKLGQFTLGFNSSGFSLGYQRDQFSEGVAGTTWRVGLGVPLRQGAIGGAVTWYRGSGDKRELDLDLGFLFRPVRGVTLGAALQHIGKPIVRDVAIPLTTVAGAQWSTLNGRLAVLGQAHIADLPGELDSGLDVTYRGGVQLAIGSQVPVVLFTALDLGTNVGIDRWHVGVRVGSNRQATAVGTLVSRNETPQLERLSLSAVASNLLTGRNR
jgi:hypothetical protein